MDSPAGRPDDKESAPRELPKGFGSFHSASVEELMSLEDEVYERHVPAAPTGVAAAAAAAARAADVPFGRQIGRQCFVLDPAWTFLNHGAFGAVLRPVLEVSQAWQVHTERQPLRFFDRELLPALVDVTRRLATFVNCERRRLVLLPNVTTGLNTVMGATGWLRAGDTLLLLSVTYGATKKIAAHVAAGRGARVIEVALPLPTTKAEILERVAAALPAHGRCLAVFDHITSNTALVLPVVELISLCRRRRGSDVRVLVDGAHAVGTLPLDMGQIDADFYVGNMHKWLCNPKGCAFLAVRSAELCRETRPLVISHGFGSGFTSEFVWSGLRDYGPFLTVAATLSFWESQGPERIRKYIVELVEWAVKLLRDAWQTGRLAEDPELQGCAMALVELPAWASVGRGDTPSFEAAQALQTLLHERHRIEVPVKHIAGKLYVRLSAHIYNERRDYEVLRDAVLGLAGSKRLDDPSSKSKL